MGTREDANAEPSEPDTTLTPSQEMPVATSPANAEPSDRDATLTPSQEMPVATSPAAPASCPTCRRRDANHASVARLRHRRIEPRFPGLSVEKEFAQVVSRAETAGQTDQQTFQAVLAEPENRYLARQLCWVLLVQGIETYLVHPRDPIDFGRLVEAVRGEPSPLDLDVVIGLRGPTLLPSCDGLMIPIVAFDQMYSFDRNAADQGHPAAGGHVGEAVRAGRRGGARPDPSSDRQRGGHR